MTIDKDEPLGAEIDVEEPSEATEEAPEPESEESAQRHHEDVLADFDDTMASLDPETTAGRAAMRERLSLEVALDIRDNLGDLYNALLWVAKRLEPLEKDDEGAGV